MTARSRGWRTAWTLAFCLGAMAFAQAPEAGDALDAGLTPPTAARYADPAWYDLLDARWATEADGSVVFELELAAIDPDAPLLQPIVEAYLLHPEATARAALPGTGLEAPEGVGWAVAVRVAGTSAWAWTVDAAAPRPLGLEVVGRTVRLPWPPDLPVDGVWVAISGVYDPFADSGWRPFAAEASPWAFAAPSAAPPVVSVVPGDDDALLRLHATARLPRPDARASSGTASPWWWWMGAGMVLVVVGLAWRGRSRTTVPDAPAAPAGEPGAEAQGAVDPPALIGDDDVGVVPEGEGEERQSEGAERSDEVAATETGAAVDASSPSSRTTRAPSPASRSAKRS